MCDVPTISRLIVTRLMITLIISDKWVTSEPRLAKQAPKLIVGVAQVSLRRYVTLSESRRTSTSVMSVPIGEGNYLLVNEKRKEKK